MLWASLFATSTQIIVAPLVNLWSLLSDIRTYYYIAEDHSAFKIVEAWGAETPLSSH